MDTRIFAVIEGGGHFWSLTPHHRVINRRNRPFTIGQHTNDDGTVENDAARTQVFIFGRHRFEIGNEGSQIGIAVFGGRDALDSILQVVVQWLHPLPNLS